MSVERINGFRIRLNADSKSKLFYLKKLKMLKLINVLFFLIYSATIFGATYYVSPLGSNTNAGTLESKPYKTVQYAIDKMSHGDTLVVLDGFYTGTLKLKSGITIKAKHPRKVVFSGAETLKGTFQKHSNNIYKIKISQDIEQLFYRNKPMTWARWPNITWAENWVESKKWVKSAKGTGPGKLTADAFDAIKNLDLEGGYCFMRYSKGNSCYSRLIESFDGNTLKWDETNFYSGAYTGEDGRRGSPAAIKKGKAKPDINVRFFLAGALSLLDSEGEWFAKDGHLYFYSAEGVPPKAEDFLIKVVDYTIAEENRISDFKIEGIDFFASSITMGNNKNSGIHFKDVQFSYIGGELLFTDNIQGEKGNRPIHVEGDKIVFEKCLIAGAQNTGLKLGGSNLIVKNCVFLENNRHANFQSRALVISARGVFNISRNTFFNNCSDAILVKWDDKIKEVASPQIAYNNIFNAGIYNSDVSGVYMPNLSQRWTEFHHNWVHNVKGNGVRLDQAGEKLSVHHNVFWASKRGLNIEGFQNFNIYNNTSIHNESPGFITLNVLDKRKGIGDAIVSNDTTFAPIKDWNVVNNLIQEFVDRVGPSEKSAFQRAEENGRLHPERAKNNVIPITDRGTIQGNLTGFTEKIFVNGSLDGLNLIPVDKIVENGVMQTKKLTEQHLTALNSYRGAYGVNDTYWYPGSNWMPYGLKLVKTMAESEVLAKKYHTVSVIPKINSFDLPKATLY